jgi:hypothetical protein
MVRTTRDRRAGRPNAQNGAAIFESLALRKKGSSESKNTSQVSQLEFKPGSKLGSSVKLPEFEVWRLGRKKRTW